MSTLGGFPIAEYRERYGLSAVAETGTYLGASVISALLAGYELVVSCELEPKFVERASSRLDEAVPDWRSRARLFEGQSVSALPEMLRAIAGRAALFFLDAHVDPSLFDGAVAPRPAVRQQSLLDELEVVITQRDVSRDVIIVDDLHLCTRERWVGDEQARIWRLPPPQFKTAVALAALFPLHVWRVVRSVAVPDPALVLLPGGAGCSVSS